MDNPEVPKPELESRLFRQQQDMLKTCLEALGSLARSFEDLVVDNAIVRKAWQEQGTKVAELEGRLLRVEAALAGNGHGAPPVE